MRNTGAVRAAARLMAAVGVILFAETVSAQRMSITTTFRQASSEGSVAVGVVDVGDAAAGLASISFAVCELLTAMQFEPIDWELTKDFYETKLLIDNEDISLRELARGGTELFTGSPSEVWNRFQNHFENEFWLDTAIQYAIEGASGVENDGARRELAQKTIRDSFGVAMTLGFLEEARRLIISAYGLGDQGWKSGLEDSMDTVLKYWDAAWVTFHGYDRGDGDTGRDCAPYGTGEARSADFGLQGDVTYTIESSFIRGRNILQSMARGRGSGRAVFVRESDMIVLGSAYDAITEAIIITYLRSTLQQVSRMDRNVPTFPANMRVHQLEGYAFFRSIEPFASNASDAAAAHIASVLAIGTNLPREDGTIDVAEYDSHAASVEAAINELLESLEIDKEAQFGRLIV